MLVWLINADGPRGRFTVRRKADLPTLIARRLIDEGAAEPIESTALKAPENAMLAHPGLRIAERTITKE